MAIELDADYPKAFYRRGSAQFGLGKYKLALADFKAVAKMHPKSRDAREKLEECKKAIRRIAFEEAIASERTVPVSQTIDLDSIGACMEAARSTRVRTLTKRAHAHMQIDSGG